MILADSEILDLIDSGAIQFAENQLVRKANGIPRISYGLSSHGYDIRLSSVEFFIFVPGDDDTEVIDPKDFRSEDHLQRITPQSDGSGTFFIMPPLSYGLGVSVEQFDIPARTMVVIVGKSTYARTGLVCNITPAESQWTGHLTLEFFNAAPKPCKIYADEGVCQALFFQSRVPCDVSYARRKGKYQGQPMNVVFPRV